MAEFMAEIYARKIKSGEITKRQAIELYRNRFQVGFMESLEAMNIAIGNLNAGENV